MKLVFYPVTWHFLSGLIFNVAPVTSVSATFKSHEELIGGEVPACSTGGLTCLGKTSTLCDEK